ATYVAFLLFAQFGFLSQLQRDLGDASRVRLAMAAMGIAGLAASLGTAWLLGRVPGPRLVRIGLGAVAAVAVISLACHGLPSLLACAAAIGASLGLLTVAVAAALPELVPARSAGLAAGLGTGIAYFVSNVPALFEAEPAVRALVPAGLAVVALLAAAGRPLTSPALLSHRPPFLRERRETAAPREGGGALSRGMGGRWERVGVRFSGRGPRPSPGLLPLLAIFLVLIWLDSAAFAVIQANPALKAETWGSDAQKLVQGGVHLVAAVAAGALLDVGAGLAVPLAAWALFAVAFPLLQHGGAMAWAAGPLYAIGISFYSTALVVAPSQGAPARWRAGLLFGVAGWIGSALGVGMAQDLGRIPGWFLLVTGAALAAACVRPSRPALRRVARLYGPALALGAAGVLGAWAAAPEPASGDSRAEAVARGRSVYVSEGCIHCHSQYVRPGTHDVAWWGPARPLDRGERPPLVGARRQGPDLIAVGNRRNDVWNEAHLRDPRSLNPGSRMPSYAHLFAGDGRRGRDLVAYLSSLGAATAVERWELTGAQPVKPPPAPPSAARGATLFAQHCATCHGTNGRGDGPLAGKLNDPRANLRKPGFASLPQGPDAEPEDQALARVIRHGLPPTSMPGHEWLTDQQVADLVAFVRTLPERKAR
ncbi:MAG TPA: cbb3-type cytochrome c oxidase subunit II, partial [Thermoanaerobaculia bacterium]|nr:cbb3-type cytochrome c oxidase subunit II [Thermoanaerobaculia bacterium]